MIRELDRQKKNLKTVAAKCMKEAGELQLAFRNWNEETLLLSSALDIKQGERLPAAVIIGQI